MSNLYARCIGLVGSPEISIDAAVVFIHRVGGIRRSEAQVAVLDYLGWQREEICEHLGISVQTIDKYWTRMYAKTGHHGRVAMRAWIGELLAQAVNE